MIERAIVVGNGKVIRLKDLPMGKDAATSNVESLDDLERIAKDISTHRQSQLRGRAEVPKPRLTLEDLFAEAADGGVKELNVIVKADTVARWHRDRFRRFWAKISQRRHPGRPRLDALKREPIFGCTLSSNGG